MNGNEVIFKDQFRRFRVKRVKYDPVFQSCIGMFKLKCDDLIKSALGENMQVPRPSQKMQSKDKTHESKVMVTMQVRNEDMVDLGRTAPELLHLDLR
jgi:hypothetical protein